MAWPLLPLQAIGACVWVAVRTRPQLEPIEHARSVSPDVPCTALPRHPPLSNPPAGTPWPHLALLLLLIFGSRWHWLPGLGLLVGASLVVSAGMLLLASA